MTYDFLQHYWCFIVALLGALLVSLLFVQGVNAVAHNLGYSEESRRLIYNSIGRKWALTSAMLVMFIGTFFVAFPLFYSINFGGAYWLWIIFLITFVLQIVSYLFQNKVKHPDLLWVFLILNGYIGPMLMGSIIATFFEGANFIVEKSVAIDTAVATPISSYWANASHGLDILINPWVLVYSVAIFFLARILGILYLKRNLADEEISSNGYGRLIAAAIHFVGLSLIFFGHLMMKDGYAYNEMGFYMEANKYLTNFTDMWYLSATLLIGLVLVLYGTLKTIINRNYNGGFWPASIGTVCIILAMILCAMWNHTAYYPSTEELQSSLTMVNSCNSESTLRTMFYISLSAPFILAYAIYRWRATGSKKLDK